MSIEIQCSQCGVKRSVNDRFSGCRVKCPQCDAPLQVPQAVVEPAILQSPTASERLATPGHIDMSVTSAAPQLASKPAIPAHSKFEEADEREEPMPERIEDDEGELDMTAMVDVTFLLLIFFMVTAAFSLQKSIESKRQQSDKPSSSAVQVVSEEVDQVTVQIDERGSFLVLAADWERETPGKQNLIAALKEANTGGEIRLSIEVHEQAKLQSLVDCMDAGTLADYTDVQVTEVDGFE